ncbi:hypothetical protein LguiB_001586 [Lonicera macranthoides]
MRDLEEDFGRSLLGGAKKIAANGEASRMYLDLTNNEFQKSTIPEFVVSLNKLQHLNSVDAGSVGRIPQ